MPSTVAHPFCSVLSVLCSPPSSPAITTTICSINIWIYRCIYIYIQRKKDQITVTVVHFGPSRPQASGQVRGEGAKRSLQTLSVLCSSPSSPAITNRERASSGDDRVGFQASSLHLLKELRGLFWLLTLLTGTDERVGFQASRGRLN